jgi:deazaflavin-dependent oxidoreductase (nitroreductase family)
MIKLEESGEEPEMIQDEFWSRMKYVQRIHRLLYALGFGPVVGKIILLLTTTGRKSGLKRITPLQYEVINGNYYLGSARGVKSDWYRNIEADRRVEIRVKSHAFSGIAEPITDPIRIADYMETRLRRHPFMMGLLMEKAHHLPKIPSRQQLLNLAASEALVIIRPVEQP